MLVINRISKKSYQIQIYNHSTFVVFVSIQDLDFKIHICCGLLYVQ